MSKFQQLSLIFITGDVFQALVAYGLAHIPCRSAREEAVVLLEDLSMFLATRGPMMSVSLLL